MTKAPPVRSMEKFMLRLPDGMRRRIASKAAANNRSMNAEIVSRLEASFENEDEAGVPDFVTPAAIEAIFETRRLLSDFIQSTKNNLGVIPNPAAPVEPTAKRRTQISHAKEATKKK